MENDADQGSNRFKLKAGGCKNKLNGSGHLHRELYHSKHGAKVPHAVNYFVHLECQPKWMRQTFRLAMLREQKADK